MQTFLVETFLIAMLGAFIILFITKIGLRNFIIEKANTTLSKLFNCDFCLSFWLSVIICVAAICLGKMDLYKLFVLPIFTTPIIRILI